MYITEPIKHTKLVFSAILLSLGHTHRQTHRTTTVTLGVTLAAYARRGLMNIRHTPNDLGL